MVNTPAASTATTPLRQGVAASGAPNVTRRPRASAFKTVTQQSGQRQRRVSIAPQQQGNHQPNPASQTGNQSNSANQAGGKANSGQAGGQANPAGAAGGQNNPAANRGVPPNQANRGGQQGGGQQQPPWYQRTGTPPPNVPIIDHNRAFWEAFSVATIDVIVEQLVIGTQHPSFQATVNAIEQTMGCFTARDLVGLRKLDFTTAGIQVAQAVKLERVARYVEYVQQEYQSFQDFLTFRAWKAQQNRAAPAPNRGGQAGGLDRQAVTDILEESRCQSELVSAPESGGPRRGGR